jgi:glycine/D-amino acid oxidase-like deaminating enzyme
MKLQTADVVVIGGGAIGAAAAFYLAKAGKRVTLVERAGLAREASGANVGLVTLFSGHSLEEPDPGPVYALTRASVDAYESLGEEVGMDIEYEQCGGVVWADSEEKLGLIREHGKATPGMGFQWSGSTRRVSASASLPSQLITGRTPFLPLDSFRLSRFESETFPMGRESPPAREAYR